MTSSVQPIAIVEMLAWAVPLALFLLATGVSAGSDEGPYTDKCTEYSSTEECVGSANIVDELPTCGNLVGVESSFLVIGDYGLSSAGCEGQVAELVGQFDKQFGIDYVVTLGDNNYWDGSCSDLFTNIGQYYGQYYTPGPNCIEPTKGFGAPMPRFWPSIGNHDWKDVKKGLNGTIPYLQYFDYLKQTPPFNGQYYNVRPPITNGGEGSIELFAVNSNYEEESEEFKTQAVWLEGALKASTAPFKLVYFHHPWHSTSQHDARESKMNMPFKEWGATMVLTGHQHVYERLEVDGMTYVVNGLGGNNLKYKIHSCPPAEGSQVRYNSYHGAMMGFVQGQELRFCFYSLEGGGGVQDQFSVAPNGTQQLVVPLPRPGGSSSSPSLLLSSSLVSSSSSSVVVMEA